MLTNDIYRLSISVIYGLAKNTNIVLTDPILWFSLMLMPAGPPALVISGLAELAQISELEKMAIAKSLSVSQEMCGPAQSFLLISAGDVRFIAVCMLQHHGRSKSISSGTGAEELRIDVVLWDCTNCRIYMYI